MNKKILFSVLLGIMSVIGVAFAEYNETYTTAELPSIAIDTGGHLLANLITYVSLIALMGIALFLWKRSKNIGKVFLFALFCAGGFLVGMNNVSAYASTYTATDYSAIVVDFVANYLVQIISFVGLIVLVVLVAWFMKQGKRFGK